ncbi:MAG TPA: prephenate dehydrogenase/arogenate dehydrogenase family protein, partial [Candidatus Binatia bacterium]|nr:prephenate dehydrogenase/arogenate dehydrogenase family protein [Candidatus Binatia bacterium]
MRLALLGLGLIGGSVVRALRRDRSGDPSDPWSRGLEIAAWSPSGEGPRRAAAEGVVDLVAGSVEAALAGADLVLLAGPPTSVLEWLATFGGPLRDHLPEDVVLTDVASTKAAIVERADALGLPFVGGHPMAGRETTGYGSARADLFEGRPWVVVPGAAADERAIGLVEGLARAVGAVPIRMTGAVHDRAVAAISHLPLLA